MLKDKYFDYGVKTWLFGHSLVSKALDTERKVVSRITTDKKAQGIIEYALILVVVSIGVLATVGDVKNKISDALNSLSTQITKIK